MQKLGPPKDIHLQEIEMGMPRHIGNRRDLMVRGERVPLRELENDVEKHEGNQGRDGNENE
jgi:hypothetical protein